MRKKIFILSVLILAFAVVADTAFTQQESDVFCSKNAGVVSFTNGCIDYNNNLIYAKGTGLIGNDQTITDAIRVAEMEAKRILAEAINEVTIDSDSERDKEGLKKNYLRSFGKWVLKGSHPVGEADYLRVGGEINKNVIVVTVRAPLQPTSELLSLMSKSSKQQLPPEKIPSPQVPESSIYSGVVIDASSFTIKPAMAPKILDEDGREVYGSAYVNREWAIDHGMAYYAKNIEEARRNERVKDSPIIVKGIKTPNGIDITISNEDARKIRNAASYQKFLVECKVTIVLKGTA